MSLRRCFDWNLVKPMNLSNTLKLRTFKNFGHKREPIPAVTTLWHGFLTFTFIGFGLNWDVLSKLIFGEKEYDQVFQDSLTNETLNEKQ